MSRLFAALRQTVAAPVRTRRVLVLYTLRHERDWRLPLRALPRRVHRTSGAESSVGKPYVLVRRRGVRKEAQGRARGGEGKRDEEPAV